MRGGWGSPGLLQASCLHWCSVLGGSQATCKLCTWPSCGPAPGESLHNRALCPGSAGDEPRGEPQPLRLSLQLTGQRGEAARGQRSSSSLAGFAHPARILPSLSLLLHPRGRSVLTGPPQDRRVGVAATASGARESRRGMGSGSLLHPFR